MLCQGREKYDCADCINELSLAVCAPSRNLVQIKNAAYRLIGPFWLCFSPDVRSLAYLHWHSTHGAVSFVQKAPIPAPPPTHRVFIPQSDPDLIHFRNAKVEMLIPKCNE